MKNPLLAWGVGCCAFALALPAFAANGSMPNMMVRDAAARRAQPQPPQRAQLASAPPRTILERSRVPGVRDVLPRP